MDNNLIEMKKQRLIIGITGASGIVYGIRLLEMLREGRLGLEAGDNVIDLRLRLNDGAPTERAGPRFS